MAKKIKPILLNELPLSPKEILIAKLSVEPDLHLVPNYFWKQLPMEMIGEEKKGGIWVELPMDKIDTNEEPKGKGFKTTLKCTFPERKLYYPIDI